MRILQFSQLIHNTQLHFLLLATYAITKKVGLRKIFILLFFTEDTHTKKAAICQNGRYIDVRIQRECNEHIFYLTTVYIIFLFTVYNIFFFHSFKSVLKHTLE